MPYFSSVRSGGSAGSSTQVTHKLHVKNASLPATQKTLKPTLSIIALVAPCLGFFSGHSGFLPFLNPSVVPAEEIKLEINGIFQLCPKQQLRWLFHPSDTRHAAREKRLTTCSTEAFKTTPSMSVHDRSSLLPWVFSGYSGFLPPFMGFRQ